MLRLPARESRDCHSIMMNGKRDDLDILQPQIYVVVASIKRETPGRAAAIAPAQLGKLRPVECGFAAPPLGILLVQAQPPNGIAAQVGRSGSLDDDRLSRRREAPHAAVGKLAVSAESGSRPLCVRRHPLGSGARRCRSDAFESSPRHRGVPTGVHRPVPTAVSTPRLVSICRASARPRSLSSRESMPVRSSDCRRCEK